MRCLPNLPVPWAYLETQLEYPSEKAKGRLD
jgi:hypothetical protein